MPLQPNNQQNKFSPLSEHNASPVEPADVARIREANKTRTHSWTAEELNPPEKVATKAKGKK
jgi:hypothetical protein